MECHSQRKATTDFRIASRITRNLALKKYEYLSAEKRKPEAICSFYEPGDCVSGKECVENEAENQRIKFQIESIFASPLFAFCFVHPPCKTSVRLEGRAGCIG